MSREIKTPDFKTFSTYAWYLFFKELGETTFDQNVRDICASALRFNTTAYMIADEKLPSWAKAKS